MKIIGTIKLNGHSFYLGLMTIKDKELLQEGFKKLSLLSKTYRFHRPKATLTENDINYFLDIDNYDHLAIGAIERRGDKKYGIGLIRYIREKNNPDCAEVGLTIIDDYQHKGLGTELYKKLLFYAKKNGLKTLINYVLNDNIFMIKLLKKFNSVSKKEMGGITKIIVTV